MKKINSNGFALAETLIVTVFLMVIFTMIFRSFIPLVGEYEKRETYDDVDGKYATYWIKKMVEDPDYQLGDKGTTNLKNNYFARFECSNFQGDVEKRYTCINLVSALQVEGCNKKGDKCEIYITPYRIGGTDKSFKEKAKSNMKKYMDGCNSSSSECSSSYISKCMTDNSTGDENDDRAACTKEANKKLFRTGMNEYIKALPDYSAESLNNAKFRVIVSYHHKKDNNNYYSYATMEVIR